MLYNPEIIKDYTAEEFDRVISMNENQIDTIDKEAKGKGELLHRFLFESVADGKAIYQITRINKKTVRISLCALDGKNCDYSVPMWGTNATIPLDYAERCIRCRDNLDKLFEKNKNSKS